MAFRLPIAQDLAFYVLIVFNLLNMCKNHAKLSCYGIIVWILNGCVYHGVKTGMEIH
jgi:hypothetical protein